jgi:hypothetical protein
MIARAVVRGLPVVRPGTVSSPLKAIGTPAARSGLAIALKSEIPRGG